MATGKRKLRLTAVATRPAALVRAFRFSVERQMPCYVLVRGTGAKRKYLAHPWPLPKGWYLLGVVTATEGAVENNR